MKKVLLYDNFDSFSYLLADYIKRAGAVVTVIKNNQDYEQISLQSFDAIVISPGPETPEKAGFLMGFLKKCYLQKPVLGVCLGHQALGLLFGFELIKAEKPMHGKVSEIMHNQKGIFSNLPQNIQVCRYHSLILQGASNEFEITAKTELGEIMAMQHKSLPLCGVQFHPEAILTQHGQKMINNWLESV